MRKSKGLLLTTALILAMAAIVGACAAPAAPAPPAPPPPTPNQSPVISQITANPAKIVAGQSTTINAVATDPDDDPITLSWSASGGTVSGTGNQVTWTSPKSAGNFTVTLTAKDNLGAQTTSSVTIEVQPTTTTVVLEPVASGTGTVDQKNGSDYSVTRAGDDDKNVGYRAFWTFNISSLAGKDIQSANLKFTTGRISGYPFAYNAPPVGLGGLWLWKDIFSGPLPAFGFIGAKLIHTTLMYEAPSVVDVTTDLKLPASYANSSFEVEALFNRVSNGNNFMDMIEWSSVVLEVTYANK
jgi:hypothetical protein